MQQSNSGAAGVFVAFVFLVALGLYFLPTIIALVRRVPDRGAVIVLNLFLGWTLIGWVVALAMAARSRSRPVVVQPQHVVVNQPAPPAGWYRDPADPLG